jgi:hypothetical protein
MPIMTFQKSCLKEKFQRNFDPASFGQLVIWSSGHLVNWSFGQLVIWSTGHLVNWPFGQLAIWSTGHLVNWSFGQLVIWSTGHLVNWSFGQLVIWSSGHFGQLENPLWLVQGTLTEGDDSVRLTSSLS